MARTAQPQALRLVALQARLLRLEGRAQEAHYLLSLPRWSFTERPDLLCEEALVLSALGRHTEASALLTRLLVLYPDNHDVIAAARAIHRHSGGR